MPSSDKTPTSQTGVDRTLNRSASSDHFRRDDGPDFPSRKLRADGFTKSDYQQWVDKYHRAGVEAPRQIITISNKECDAGIKRLREKIGRLVMDDEHSS